MNAFANIKTITKRELGAYFSSPLAYIFIVIFLLLCGFFTFFVGGFFERGEASLVRPFFDWHPWFYLFLVPAVGMRLWAEERRVGTIELLLTMPITAWQAIVGKFVASWLFLGLALVLTFPVVITVNILGSPDNGIIFTGYVGSWLMAGAYLAVSCLTSALTRSQVVSFIIAVVACLFLVLAGFPPVLNLAETLDLQSNGFRVFWVCLYLLLFGLAAFLLLRDTPMLLRILVALFSGMLPIIGPVIMATLLTRGARSRLLSIIGISLGWSICSSIFLSPLRFQTLGDFLVSFSVMTHFEGFQKGVLDLRDLIFFFSVIGFSLFTTSVILRTHRAG